MEPTAGQLCIALLKVALSVTSVSKNSCDLRGYLLRIHIAWRCDAGIGRLGLLVVAMHLAPSLHWRVAACSWSPLRRLIGHPGGVLSQRWLLALGSGTGHAGRWGDVVPVCAHCPSIDNVLYFSCRNIDRILLH